MTSPSAHAQPGGSSSPDALLHRMERVRALAGQLVRQAADQDDLVQEAVLRALSKPREVMGDPEPWIRRVVQNLAIDRQRASARRRNHESSAVDAWAVQESTAESIARAEQQRDLVSTVLELKEPYRSVVLQRFFDGLPPREIAKRSGVPVATVKKQLERGMALLRKELEDTHGGNGAWAVALLPLLPKATLKSLAAGTASASAAGSLVGSSLAWIVAATAFAAMGVLWWATSDLSGPSDGPRAPEAVERVATLSSEPRAKRTPRVEPSASSRSTAFPTAAREGPVAASTRRVFTGTFVDSFGEPVPGVTARCRAEGEGRAAEGEPATGDEAGAVVASLEAAPGDRMVVEVSAEGFAAATYRFRPNDPATGGATATTWDVGVQTLHRAADLSVGVVDADGEALLGWEMSYFHYGGGDRLERARISADPITGRAEFRGIAAAEVEVMARHPSGAEIHHPRRRLDAANANTIDLVYLGADPARRVGVALTWPGMARDASGEPIEVALGSSDGVIARASVALGEVSAAFEDVPDGEFSLLVDDPRFEVAAALASPGSTTPIELRGNASLRLAVTESDGRAITGYALELRPGLDGSDDARVRRGATTAPENGQIDHVLPGQPFTLRVIASDGRQAACQVAPLLPRETRVVALALGDGVTPVDISVARGEGGAVVGAEVALFDREVPPGSALERRAVAMVGGADPRAGEPLRLIARARTNASGETTLWLASHDVEDTMTALAVSGDHALARVSNGAARLRLSALGEARVVVQGMPDAEELPAGVALTLISPTSVSGHRSVFGPGVVLEPDGSGAFTTKLAPVGPATVWLSFSDFNHTGRGTTLGGITGPVGYPVGALEVTADGAAELAVDVSELWPGSLEVEVKSAGLPIGDALVELAPVGSHADLPYPFGTGESVSRVLTKITDGAGRARFPRVPKGRWRIRVRDSEWLWASEPGECEIRSGARESRMVALQLGEGAVTLLDDATGAALRDRGVSVEMAPGVRVPKATDEAGRLRLRLGPGAYRVTVGTGPDALSALLEWDVDGPVHPELALSQKDK